MPLPAIFFIDAFNDPLEDLSPVLGDSPTFSISAAGSASTVVPATSTLADTNSLT